jgi:hypothetical protein
MKSTENIPVPGRAPIDSPHPVQGGKDPKYLNTEVAQNFPRGVHGVAESQKWGPQSTSLAKGGANGTASG